MEKTSTLKEFFKEQIEQKLQKGDYKKGLVIKVPSRKISVFMEFLEDKITPPYLKHSTDKSSPIIGRKTFKNGEILLIIRPLNEQLDAGTGNVVNKHYVFFEKPQSVLDRATGEAAEKLKKTNLTECFVAIFYLNTQEKLEYRNADAIFTAFSRIIQKSKLKNIFPIIHEDLEGFELESGEPQKPPESRKKRTKKKP